jgi:eukaryotic-like serine/threonine-protein kinase
VPSRATCAIIHRDIKPSNILVTTTSESVASPVVIDFGIAKATTNERLTEKTLFTAREMLIGTPAYMSPEQAALTGAGIDTRTDIYSLGVLLYELLSGSTPFDTTAASKSGLDEIRRVILEEEPVRPSMRLSRLAAEELTKMALMRRSEPATFIRAIHGDLDWIVMKALEKDRARRYPTASDLALDIQRFLASETVFARPPSQFYRFQKAVSRHRVFFTAIMVIALFLIISLIVVSTSLAKERRSRLAAQAASVKSEQVTKFLEDMLNGVDPSVARGEDTKMLQGILDQTAERIGKEMTNQPAVEAELRDLIGTVYYRLGNYQRAAEMHRAAVAIQQRLFGQQSGEAATALNVLGRDLLAERKLPEAESVVEKGLSIRRRLLGETNGDTASSLNDLSAVYRDEGKLKEAETMAGEALGIRQILDGTETLDVAKSFRNLCIILGDEGKFAEAETNAQKMLAIRRRLLDPEDPEVASALADAGWAAKGSGDLGQAEAFYRECLEIRLKLLGPDHPDSLSASQDLSLSLAHEGKWTEAESLERQALAGWRKRGGEENPKALGTMAWLCWIFESENKWSEAEALQREIFAYRRK